MAKDALDDLIHNLKRLEKKGEVSFGEMLTSKFMRRYTQCSTIDEFLQKLTEETGHKAQTEEDFASVPTAERDAFVATHSRFRTWEDMLGKAGEEYVAGQLNLG